MPRIRYKKTSPYAATNQTSWYLDFYQDQELPFFEDDSLIYVAPRFQYRPDLLSQELYGTTDFWWVFQRRNMNVIKDPIWDFQANIQIYVPSAQSLLNYGI